MEDIFVLEGREDYQDRIMGQIPRGLTHKLARDGKEFEDYLAQGNNARLYFLDDQVPDSSGRLCFLFLKHCAHLLEQRPDAKVFYHGSDPEKSEEDYCREHNISIISRFDIGATIRRELGIQ